MHNICNQRNTAYPVPIKTEVYSLYSLGFAGLLCTCEYHVYRLADKVRVFRNHGPIFLVCVCNVLYLFHCGKPHLIQMLLSIYGKKVKLRANDHFIVIKTV